MEIQAAKGSWLEPPEGRTRLFTKRYGQRRLSWYHTVYRNTTLHDTTAKNLRPVRNTLTYALFLENG